MSKVTDQGIVDLLIRIYSKNMNYPKGGEFSQYIDHMKEGDILDVTGIAGDIHYLGDSEFMIRNQETKEMEQKRFKKVGMIAAGAGLTPMFQLIQTVADTPGDLTSLSLIYSCSNPVSVILIYRPFI
jgi:cytochrome-b5 reductase